jgi:uncharacterized membrane protein
MRERRSKIRPPGVTALAVFFATGTIISFISAVSLLIPGNALEPIWQINPHAREQFIVMGHWSSILLFVVSLLCRATAIGCWRGRQWGYRLAIGLFTVNLAGDLLNATIAGERRVLVGIPIVCALLWYLSRPVVRAYFASTKQQLE